MTYDLGGYIATMKALSNFKKGHTDMISISRGPRLRALGVVLYGPEGIGKTTLASQFPQPIFIDLEHGSDTMDVVRADAPSTFEDFLELLKELKNEKDFRTVVIDTADKLEQLITEHVLQKYSIDSIEAPGYGKGYTYIADEFVRFLKACGELIDAGKNVVIVAHAMMRKFEQPDEMGAYDRWELKLSRKAAPLVKEWADMVLFLNYKTMVFTDKETKSKKAGGGKRVMYATHHPAWDAKNRFGLPDEMDMDFANIAQCFENVPAPRDPVEKLKEDLYNDKVTEEDIIAFIRSKDPKLREDATSIDMLPPVYIKWVIENYSKIITKIKEANT